MAERSTRLPQPRYVVAASLVVIVVFALLFPLVGHVEDTTLPEGERALGFLIESPSEQPGYYATVVFPRLLHLSVSTFTLVGSSALHPVGTGARLLADLEALLGYVFLAALVASLVREGER